MTLNEAIEGLKTRLTPKGVIQFGEPDNDIRLGIEALKWYKRWRSACHAAADYLLRGIEE